MVVTSHVTSSIRVVMVASGLGTLLRKALVIFPLFSDLGRECETLGLVLRRRSGLGLLLSGMRPSIVVKLIKAGQEAVLPKLVRE